MKNTDIKVIMKTGARRRMLNVIRQKNFFLRLVLLMFSCAFLKNANAVTAANTLIQNRADISYDTNSGSHTDQSNIDSFRTDEVVDLTLTSNNGTNVAVRSPDSDKVLAYTLTNTGNGVETFSIQSSQSLSDDFDSTSIRIYLDSNANGIFEPLIDTLYTSGTNDPVLNAATSKVLFVVANIPAALSNNKLSGISLTATSATGTGAMGSALAGQGTGGVNAVFGASTGTATAEGTFVTTSVASTFTKTQSILDPDGGSAPIQNAVITYTLHLDVQGTGTLTSSIIQDLIPANTSYIPGSLKLNNIALTDSADADQGVFNGTVIQVDLGSVVAPTTADVSFQVRIQ